MVQRLLGPHNKLNILIETNQIDTAGTEEIRLFKKRKNDQVSDELNAASSTPEYIMNARPPSFIQTALTTVYKKWRLANSKANTE